jgi:hypothetical protein
MWRDDVKSDEVKRRNQVQRYVCSAGLQARKTARAHGTPIYIWRDGKVVAEKP